MQTDCDANILPESTADAAVGELAVSPTGGGSHSRVTIRMEARPYRYRLAAQNVRVAKNPIVSRSEYGFVVVLPPQYLT
jgi:hypothetical protein